MKSAKGTATLVVLFIFTALFLLLQTTLFTTQQLYELALFRKDQYQSFWYTKGIISYGQQLVQLYGPDIQKLLQQQKEVKLVFDDWLAQKGLQALLSLSLEGKAFLLHAQLVRNGSIVYALKEKISMQKTKKAIIDSFEIVSV